MAANATSVPLLDYSLVADHRQTFVHELRNAVVNVGFFYLSNTPISIDDINDLIASIPRLFDLPKEAKDKISIKNSPHFFGYSRFASELTKGQADQREHFEFGTPHVCRWKPGDPEYLKTLGPSQWPEEVLLPGFRELLLRYLAQVQDLSYKVVSLIAEALGLQADALALFYEELVQHNARILKYYPRHQTSSDQGVGAHYDAGFLTILLQASPHKGLQVQTLTGDWIEVPPVPGTFVINIGKSLEFVSQGLARATSHRVIAPKGPEPRYSLPFFQNIRLNARLTEHILQLPPDILKLKDQRGKVSETESINYPEFDREPYGQTVLISRVKSHPDAAQIHYPDLFNLYFPGGLPSHGTGY